MRRVRRGFTLLEMLTVMGIMLILAGLAVIGFEQLDRSASGKQTRALLDDCTAMLNEFEAESGGIQALGGNGAVSTTNPYPGGAGGPLGGGAAANEVTDMAITAAPSSTTFLYDRYGTAVQKTWFVMAYLMRDPKVKEMVQKLPTNRILTAINTTTGTMVPYTPPLGTAGAGVVLLDGWGNPIIFIPANGINVWKKGQKTPTLIVSRDGRPFFASAGPDGDFGADQYSTTLADPINTDRWTDPGMNTKRTPMGDDNIYSFENGQ